jgi:hypothetical protein
VGGDGRLPVTQPTVKTSKPAGDKPTPRRRGSHKITRPRARTKRRAETLDPPNTPQQARTLLAKGRFLADFALCGNVLRSAAAARINRRTVYTWLGEDTKFKALYDEALQDALDRLEEEARRRAIDGWMEPVVSGGNLVTHVRKYSDTLLVVLLKGKRPDTFRERHEITGKNGTPLLTPEAAAKLTDEELKAEMQAEAALLLARAEKL